MTPGEWLNAAILEAVMVGDRIPCGSIDVRDWFFSDRLDDRQRAAALCNGCPVIAECGAAADANAERCGVWADTDRNHQPKRKQVAA